MAGVVVFRITTLITEVRGLFFNAYRILIYLNDPNVSVSVLI